MMNLHDIAGPCIASVNPPIQATYRQSLGYSTAPSGTRTPTYADDITVSIQLQGMSESLIKHMNSLNVGGILRKVYGDGQLSSLVRRTGQGGDIFVINGVTWLLVQVMEQWPDWCSVIVQQQVD